MKITAQLRDTVVLVDLRDREVGTLDKVEAHSGRGTLHRAISVFLTDENGRILMQKRHPEKLVWGGYWSNSCCTHPVVGEATLDCATRRVYEELGLLVDLTFHFKLKYQALFSERYAEHELVSVYTGTVATEPTIDHHEIAELRWIETELLIQEFITKPNDYTPWCILEWRELRARHIL